MIKRLMSGPKSDKERYAVVEYELSGSVVTLKGLVYGWSELGGIRSVVVDGAERGPESGRIFFDALDEQFAGLMVSL
jgi:N-acetylglutamate synthase-like GNAT family acetyltransferase